MTRRLGRVLGAWALVFCSCSLSHAQGAITASLSGTVVDTAGGVVPGATVTVRHIATGAAFDTVTNGEGTFTVSALEAGSYSVTISLSGFKTAVLDHIDLTPGPPATVNVELEVGNLSETITVQGASDIVNTQTATVTSTLDVDEISNMPLPVRDVMNAVTVMSGVNTPGINRGSNINGLPRSFIAISLDGVNINENFNKTTDGFFARVTPRQDAVEAVTVTSAVGGAEIGGHGAVQISFVTRSGTNRFVGSAYDYYRHPRLNTNSWFNERKGLPKNDVKMNQYGIRQGGPIVIPGLYDGRSKAFFFFNYEELRQSNNFSRVRNVLTPLAQQGIFSYARGGSIETANLLALAESHGHTAVLDPLVQRVLSMINAATRLGGVLNPHADPNLVEYTWQSPGEHHEKQPVLRLDYNLSPRHRLTGSYNWQVVTRDPDHVSNGDVRFPGAHNYSKHVSYRPLSSGALRSTLGSNLVNELRGGIRWGPGYFGQPSSNGRHTFDDTDWFALDLTASDTNEEGLDLANWHTENSPTARSAWSWNIDDTLNWQKGQHSLGLGASLYFGRVWQDSQQVVPGIVFGVDQNDPAFSMFNTTSLPGASIARLNEARELYALLTGRVTSVTGQATLNAVTNRYEYLGTRRRAGTMNEYSLFVQDHWRLTPTLTLGGGVRWDVQMPFAPLNDVMSYATLADACGISGMTSAGTCRFFEPGAAGGQVPEFRQFARGTHTYRVDWNNLGPNVSIAWRPNVGTGFLRRVLGDPQQATLRAGFSVAYERQGMSVFTRQYGANPGSMLPLARSAANGLLVSPGEALPVYLSERDRLYPQPFPETPLFPIAVRANRADDINIFHPDIEIGSARTWTVSLQRALAANAALEVRYVGTRGVNQWMEENYNELNIIENGFLDEFRLAQANLQANNTAGGTRRGSFAYFGSDTGTVPLPIYLAYLNGSADASNPLAYTGFSWISSVLAGRLVRPNPRPFNAAADLDINATRRANALRAGLPANFFVINPHVDDVNVFVSKGFNDYHALQIELRRRLARGLQVNGNYQYALARGSSNLGQRYGRVMDPAANVRHAIKMHWNWNVPVGRGRRFGRRLSEVLNGALGGWQFSGVGRAQARLINFGNVRLVGMTRGDLTKMFKIRYETDPEGIRRVYLLPADVILNTRRAFSISTTSATGYSDLGAPEGKYIAPADSEHCIEIKNGDCAPRRVLVRAPWFNRYDVGLAKRFPLRGRTNVELRLDVLNIFDNVNFTPLANPGASPSIFEVTSAYSDLNNTFDPGGRLAQLVFRLNW